MASGDTVFEISGFAVLESYRQQMTSPLEWTVKMETEGSVPIAGKVQIQANRDGSTYPTFDGAKRYKIKITEV